MRIPQSLVDHNQFSRVTAGSAQESHWSDANRVQFVLRLRTSYVQVGAGSLDPFGRRDTERSMSAKIGAALSHVGAKGTYDYDFGSTTRLTVTLADAREGRIGRTAVRLLARNDPPAWACGVCGEPATQICCLHESDDSPFVCAAHQTSHGCPDETFLPVVNSPRMGVCAYSG